MEFDSLDDYLESNNSFESRMEDATEEEKTCASRLQALNCKVELFGQSLFSHEVREMLKIPYPSVLLIRWLADLIVWRPDLQPTRAVNLEANLFEGTLLARARNYVFPKIPRVNLSPNILEIEWRWLVDVKSGRVDTPFWDLEQAALESHRLQRFASNIPIIITWPDGISCSYVEDIEDEILKEGSYTGNGSGTPYWLIPKNKIPFRTLEEVFGKGILAAREPDEARTREEKFQLGIVPPSPAPPPPVPPHTPLTLTTLNTWWRTIQYRIKTHGAAGSRVAALTNNLDKERVVTEREPCVIVLRARAMFHYSALGNQPDIELIEWAIKTEFQQECKVRLLSPQELLDWDELPPNEAKEVS